MPELPDQTRDRLEEVYKLPIREVDILARLGENDAGERGQGLAYFEKVVKQRDPKIVANW